MIGRIEYRDAQHTNDQKSWRMYNAGREVDQATLHHTSSPPNNQGSFFFFFIKMNSLVYPTYISYAGVIPSAVSVR